MDTYLPRANDPMRTLLGAAYYCITPSMNQIYLKSLYNQESDAMPSTHAAYTSDANQGTHEKYLKLLTSLPLGPLRV